MTQNKCETLTDEDMSNLYDALYFKQYRLMGLIEDAQDTMNNINASGKSIDTGWIESAIKRNVANLDRTKKTMDKITVCMKQ